MFQIIDPGSKVPLAERGKAIRVVDSDRNLSLRKVRTFGMDEARLFELTWGRRAIPVFANVDKSSESPGKPRTTYVLRFVSDVPEDLLRESTLTNFTFASSEERIQAVAYAIEALCAFGSSYNGLLRPADRSWVVGLDGKAYNRLDFGYGAAPTSSIGTES